MSNPVLDALKAVRDTVWSWLVTEEKEAEDFLVAAAEYASKNITPEMLKIVTDCTLAAEQAFAGPGQGDAKWEFAFANIIAALGKDAIAFFVSDVNYAIEAVVQHRNAVAAGAAIPLPQPSPATGASTA